MVRLAVGLSFIILIGQTMKQNELISALKTGALSKYSALYSDIEEESKRFIQAIGDFASSFGEGRDISVFSVPGRSEIIGNHTDHNGGKVMAGAITRDIIAVAAKNDDGVVRFRSEGYAEDFVRLDEASNPDAYRRFTSRALVAGMVGGFKKHGWQTGGFDVYMTTKVLKGSGLSSSAAFEVMIGNVMNHLYCGGSIDNVDIAKIAQYSENVYFGKPCGLMDQMACAVGSFVYIDFEKEESPIIRPVDFSLSDAGYALCIVNTGGSHANLNDDYAAVPAEMKGVAKLLGREKLVGVTEESLISASAKIRQSLGDRAFLRAVHFVRECKRVDEARDALLEGRIDGFLDALGRSGDSSFKYLQNVYTTKAPTEQGLSLALALTDGFLRGRGGACRVHGGGFAGTIQAFVKREHLSEYAELIESVFGKGTCDILNIRPLGAVKLF